MTSAPFADFAPAIQPQTELRARITAAYRRPEPECLPPLIEAASLPEELKGRIAATARTLVNDLRGKTRNSGVEGLIHEYSLSSQEGVALMCLAEALLRIPDRATRDALIRDKIGTRDWRSHIGHSPSMFVNAATWGLVVTGKLTGTVNENSLASALTRVVARCGEPVIRKGVDLAMRMMGEQFVTGQTIGEALGNARKMEAKGFRYSYDMLGEAATTAADADRYLKEYENAIHAIGKAAGGRGVYEGPGISIKLSALHPRYSRAQADRVMSELLPRVQKLAALAKSYDIGLNIDAEESDRLELSLDLLEALCLDTGLQGWKGIGFVVQAYGKRCPFVLDFIIDLARRTGQRLMVRLVKGAYWDAEIKRAQIDGQSDFPVYTRKIHTDVSYIACARKLLAAPDAVFPQFATHNAQTLATIYHLAGADFSIGQYEFQCLHGMGEPLYEEVVGGDKLNRPCRIYAPVGTHETLLAYLVRRLLENGANSSFVNRIADPAVPVEELAADPVDLALAITPPGAPHTGIAHPAALFGRERLNSAGYDLSNEDDLALLAGRMKAAASQQPLSCAAGDGGTPLEVRNPADRNDFIGHWIPASPSAITAAFTAAAGAAPRWAATAPAERAASLDRAADLMQERMPELLSLIIREAGKSLPNAIAEVREAIDFLRYYARQVRQEFAGISCRPLGPVVCISPWNFPLAIFIGQVAAALAAGNPVLAKPAEETPLIAAIGISLLHEAGIPCDVLHLVPGAGDVGAALVGHEAVAGVMFTGSTEVARIIQQTLSRRIGTDGQPIPLIAETGGQNAMIVDSSALAEQVVGDVIASAFDSAGQRCSALRILCLQEDVADRTLTMLKGALQELRLGRPDRLAVDIGPVITAEAQANILAHIEKMRAKGCRVEQLALPPEAAAGTFVPPTLIELQSVSELDREVFGPVLHVIRFRRDELDLLIDRINATGYGLTFGLHTRLDETIAHVTSRIAAGNLYVNRNTIGAVVGVQPFGGRGLSGTGPKAGGPLYLLRLLSGRPPLPQAFNNDSFADWVARQGFSAEADACRRYADHSPLGRSIDLPGPVGERNIYETHPRGRVLLIARTEGGLLRQLGAAFATGNRVVVEPSRDFAPLLAKLPPEFAARVSQSSLWTADGPLAAALVEAETADMPEILGRIAALPGPLVLTQGLTPQALASREADYALEWLIEERSVSINTAAAGGNASLMALS